MSTRSSHDPSAARGARRAYGSGLTLCTLVALGASAPLASPARAQGAPPAAHASAAAQDDPMAPYRERFKLGMDRYKSGNTGEAIQYWEAIYRELGPQKGYRLSFNLGRAYETVGESTRAAEHYEAFLDAVTARRERGEALEPIVVREESETKDHLSQLQAIKGRIRVTPGAQPIVAQVDRLEPRLGAYVTYVAPGPHVVTFGPGSTSERRELEVKAGEIVDVAPAPAPPPTAPPGPATGATPNPASAPPGPAIVLPRPAPTVARARPFSPIVLYVAGGVTLASVVVPILTYENAWSIVRSYRGDTAAASKNAAVSSYGPAKTAAYATLAVPIALAAATAGLVTYYLAGGKASEVSAGVAPQAGGASAVVAGRF